MGRSIFILSLLYALILQGCGGGSNQKESTGDSSLYKHTKITIAGSSITWGSGYLGEESYVGEVERHFREEIATTIIPDNLGAEVLEDKMSYRGKLYKFSEGDEIAVTLKAQEISIAFAKERGSEGAIVEVIVDGKSIDEFSTKGEDVEEDRVFIQGDGKQRSFDLGRAHTFDHSVPNYSKDEWSIVRKEVTLDSGKKSVHHFVVFNTPPSNNFYIDYKYGVNIKPVKSTVDNVEREIGSELESSYGDKYTTDLSQALQATEGLDFRETDKRAVKSWKLDENREHNFTLKVKSGEFILNFITDHMYYFQNAGIGGARAVDLDATDPKNSSLRTTDRIIEFKPDLFILESSTNDANTWDRERSGEPSTNEWIVSSLMPTLYFTKKGEREIELERDIGLEIKRGDIVVIGRYDENRGISSVATRVVAKDSNSKTIVLTEDLPPNDDISYQCVIKRVSSWESNVKKIVDQVTDGLNYNIKVGIGTSGVPNLNERRLLGYREKGIVLAKENGWLFFDFFNKTKEFNGGVVERGLSADKRWSFGDNTHPGPIGYRLFGEAINVYF